MLTESKFSKYLLYAIGEIFLVLVGILLALQINTWNNERSSKLKRKEIYKQIQTDLKADTTAIGYIIKSNDEKSNRIQNILDKKIKPSFYDTINSLNYTDCKICISESTNYIPFIPISKGYSLLKNQNDIKEITKDSLPNIIEEFYSYGLTNIENQLELVQNVVFENIKTYEQYSWFVDMQEKKYNKDYLTFIFESETYRNQLARYKIYYEKNYISNLRLYREYATEILIQLEVRIE